VNAESTYYYYSYALGTCINVTYTSVTHVNLHLISLSVAYTKIHTSNAQQTRSEIIFYLNKLYSKNRSFTSVTNKEEAPYAPVALLWHVTCCPCILSSTNRHTRLLSWRASFIINVTWNNTKVREGDYWKKEGE